MASNKVSLPIIFYKNNDDENLRPSVTRVDLVCVGSCYRLGFMLTCLGGLQIQQWNVDHQEDGDDDDDNGDDDVDDDNLY